MTNSRDAAERDAVRRIQRGDIAGLEDLVQRYQLQAARAAYLVVRDRSLAQDLVKPHSCVRSSASMASTLNDPSGRGS